MKTIQKGTKYKSGPVEWKELWSLSEVQSQLLLKVKLPKNDSTDVIIRTCNSKGSSHGNSICVKVKGVELSTQKAAFHSLKVFAFKFLDDFYKKIWDILDKSISGSSKTRWLKTGHQTTLFIVSDFMKNKIEGQGEFVSIPPPVSVLLKMKVPWWGWIGMQLIFRSHLWGPAIQVY
jgi:hypothetical protein